MSDLLRYLFAAIMAVMCLVAVFMVMACLARGEFGNAAGLFLVSLPAGLMLAMALVDP